MLRIYGSTGAVAKRKIFPHKYGSRILTDSMAGGCEGPSAELGVHDVQVGRPYVQSTAVAVLYFTRPTVADGAGGETNADVIGIMEAATSVDRLSKGECSVQCAEGRNVFDVEAAVPRHLRAVKSVRVGVRGVDFRVGVLSLRGPFAGRSSVQRVAEWG